MKKNAIYKYIQNMTMIRTTLALLILLDGLLIILPILASYNINLSPQHHNFVDWLQSLGFIKLLDIPRFAIGVVLIILALPIYLGIRIGWVFSCFMLFVLVLINLLLARENVLTGTLSLLILIALIANWKIFHRHSLSGAGFVAFVSLIALLGYSVFGSLYLGDQFQPHITDISSAFYFALVCMTTVGFGDIVPISVEARLFTISIVILGITIFTTSIVYFLGVFAKSTQEIVKKRLFRMKDHYVIVGASPLALNTYHGLKKRDLDVMVLCKEEHKNNYPDNAPVITTSQINKKSLNQVNLAEAKALFILGDLDAENTIAMLAAKEIVGANIKSVMVVNDDNNYENLKLLHADLLISLSSLGSEVLIKMIFGESINSQIIENIIFSNNILDS
ncbi:ion channel [Providencia rettgeri]|uniref:NAD-binding protein n=1 Tax=Providencia stuartii TaxID=588 RepID=A0AAI9GFZ4_PROST|nr:NAD-binding protein [Providencia stuartii]MDV5224923.1 ion channel [Providencia rettgeri]